MSDKKTMADDKKCSVSLGAAQLNESLGQSKSERESEKSRNRAEASEEASVDVTIKRHVKKSCGWRIEIGAGACT